MSMLDGDKLARLNAIAPAARAFAVAPHDSNNLAAGVCSRLYVGTGGTLAVVFADDSVCPYTAADGAYLWVAAKRVNATGTTATNVVAEYGPVRSNS